VAEVPCDRDELAVVAFLGRKEIEHRLNRFGLRGV
jgi:hypothetical protein